MTNFIYWLGDVFNAFFNVFEKLGNVPNYFFIVVGFLGLFYWLNMQKKLNKKAQEQNTLR